MSTSDWAKLRQVVIGTATHEHDVAVVREAFNLGEPFADPEVGTLGLTDATFQISAERYLEVVGTIDPTGPMSKWLAKIGRRGGYVLSVQHPDPDAVRRRCVDRGLRIGIDTVAFGKTVLQLHPRDFGTILEVDGIEDPDVWFWDEHSTGVSPSATVSDVVGVEVPVADPEAMTDRWAYALGIGKAGDTEIDLSGAWVRFVPGEQSERWTVVLRTSGGASVPDLDGVTFQLV